MLGGTRYAESSWRNDSSVLAWAFWRNEEEDERERHHLAHGRADVLLVDGLLAQILLHALEVLLDERADRVDVAGLDVVVDGVVQVACNDPNALIRLLDDERNGPILAAAESPTGSFSGVTYDGRHLCIHLQGPLASDPQRATQLARLIWEPWV